jgi:hypothetical protein
VNISRSNLFYGGRNCGKINKGEKTKVTGEREGAVRNTLA